MTRQWLLPFSLLTLLLGSSWFLERLSVNTTKQESDLEQQEADYSIDDFTTTAMDKTGRPQYRLEAKRMIHYPTTDTSELEKPHFIFFDATNYDRSQKIPIDREKLPSGYPAWHAKSEQGRVLGDSRIVFLLGKVRLWKNNDAGIMEFDVRTRNLRLLPDLNYGETNEAVIIRTATSETRSIGMRTHIKPSRIELLSRVETMYEKPRLSND
uniref:Lipopolysaccharide export system protein LptC n=1 Tax=Candidatus Kentrum sp. TUN TaxID=2126343 RepID=A0A450ZNM1_9GAMM|nr:MAG: lipopolysaccharide export system protein LptC [Candidatus Kentron sp. TUN]VFK61452.1 MAG: lipopolysaccharide export system protein LptC [Candidatus Kentron sp. TUN]